jgi:hypothetical protein
MNVNHEHGDADATAPLAPRERLTRFLSAASLYNRRGSFVPWSSRRTLDMARVGDDKAGFSMRDDDPSPHRVEVIAWGFWTIEVAAAFASTVIARIRERPRGVQLLLDMSELKPMREQGQDAFATLIRALPSLGVVKTQVVTTSPLTRLQLVRVATQTGVGSTIEWINSTNALVRDN